MRQQLNNILIIKPSSLGDIVQALPTLSALRKSYPHARISWLVRSEFAPLIENHPYLDEVILFDRKFLGKALYNLSALSALCSLILQLRRSRFDAVLDLQGLFRTASLAWLSGCRNRFGMADAREFAHLFYNHETAPEHDHLHVVDYYLDVARAAGADECPVEFILPVNPTAADSAKQLLSNNQIRQDDYCVLIPGAAHLDKRWPVENFAVVAKRLSDSLGLSLIATGSATEMSLLDELAGKANVPVLNLAGKTDIRVLVELLRGAKLVVSNDTGPGHIAAALQRPLVMIFGRTNPARVAPYNRPLCVAAVDAAGRGSQINSTNPRHDIKNVTVDEVLQKAAAQLHTEG